MIRSIIKRLILESFKEDNFDFQGEELEMREIGYDAFYAIKKLEKLPYSPASNDFDFIKWSLQNMGPIEGAGFSRVTFNVPDRPGILFKIPRNSKTGLFSTKGAISNRQEISIFNQLGGSGLFPRVFMNDKLGNWFFVEKVKIIEDDDIGYKKLGEAIAKESEMIGNIERTIMLALPPQEKNKVCLDTVLDAHASIEVYENPQVYFYFKFVESDYNEFVDFVGEAIVEADPNANIDDPYEVARKIYSLFLKDSFLNKLKSHIMLLGINGFDIGPGNVGISELDGKLKIIDVSIIVR